MNGIKCDDVRCAVEHLDSARRECERPRGVEMTRHTRGSFVVRFPKQGSGDTTSENKPSHAPILRQEADERSIANALRRMQPALHKTRRIEQHNTSFRRLCFASLSRPRGFVLYGCEVDGLLARMDA